MARYYDVVFFSTWENDLLLRNRGGRGLNDMITDEDARADGDKLVDDDLHGHALQSCVEQPIDPPASFVSTDFQTPFIDLCFPFFLHTVYLPLPGESDDGEDGYLETSWGSGVGIHGADAISVANSTANLHVFNFDGIASDACIKFVIASWGD